MSEIDSESDLEIDSDSVALSEICERLDLGVLQRDKVFNLRTLYRNVKRFRGGLFYRNVKRFRGGLVFKAHRLLYHSTLGLRAITNKRIKFIGYA